MGLLLVLTLLIEFGVTSIAAPPDSKKAPIKPPPLPAVAKALPDAVLKSPPA